MIKIYLVMSIPFDDIWQDASTAESARATALGLIPGRQEMFLPEGMQILTPLLFIRSFCQSMLQYTFGQAS